MRGDAAKCGEGVDIRELGCRVRGGFTDEHLPWLSGVVESLRKDGLAVTEERAAFMVPRAGDAHQVAVGRL